MKGCFLVSRPVWGRGTPCPSLIHSLPHLLLFFAFPFYFSYSLYLFSYLSIPSLSTRTVPLRLQSGGRRKRSNLGLVFVLSVFFRGQGCMLIMAALCNRGTLYFCPVISIYLLYSSIFPRLISAATDWISTILLHMAWP